MALQTGRRSQAMNALLLVWYTHDDKRAVVTREGGLLDLNHPLAGEHLTFEIQLMEILGQDAGFDQADEVPMANWNAKMKKAELLEVARSQGLDVNTRSTKAQIIEALST